MDYIIGQTFGILMSICCFIGPFFKRKWMMLVNTIAANLFVILSLIFLNEIGSAVFLNLVAIVQSIVSLYHVKKQSKVTLFEQIIFSVLYVGFGIFGMVTASDFVWGISAKNALEMLPIIGALFLMISVFVRDEQKTRWFSLGNCLIWTDYYAFLGATAIFGEIFGAITVIVALYAYRKGGAPSGDIKR